MLDSACKTVDTKHVVMYVNCVYKDEGALQTAVIPFSTEVCLSVSNLSDNSWKYE